MNAIVPQNIEHIREQLATIELSVRKIDLANDTEKDLLTQLNTINKASYSAMNTIKQDINNR